MKLFVFDSCPFCVRVRALIDLKQIKCSVEYLIAGELPIELSGAVERFTVPILARHDSESGKTVVMQESSDIFRYLDNINYVPLFENYGTSTVLKEWLRNISVCLDSLCYPRMRLLELPELGSSSARTFFEVSRRQKLGMTLQQALEKTEHLVLCAKSHLNKLESLFDIKSLLDKARPITIDDIYLFSTLRNLTMVDELEIPDLINQYLTRLSQDLCVPLYAGISCSDFDNLKN